MARTACALALVAVLWRAGLRISEALALTESDVDPRRGSVLVRHGKGDKRREAGMDDWGFDHLARWLERRVELPIGPLFCVIDGSTRGRSWSATAVRAELRRLAAEAGVRRRFAPHQLRHAHAVELAREGVAVNLIQRQLGHTDLGTTSAYLQGIDPAEIINAVHSRRAPMIPATAGLQLLSMATAAPARPAAGAAAPRSAAAVFLFLTLGSLGVTAESPPKRYHEAARARRLLVVRSERERGRDPRARFVGGSEAAALAGKLHERHGRRVTASGGQR